MARDKWFFPVLENTTLKLRDSSLAGILSHLILNISVSRLGRMVQGKNACLASIRP
jgi:hypothetical protein